MKRRSLAILFAACLSVSSLLRSDNAAPVAEGPARHEISEGEKSITKTIEVGDHLIVIKNWPQLADNVNGRPAEGILTVEREGISRTIRREGAQFQYRAHIDLTSDEVDDLVFTTWTGGAHASFELVVFDSGTSRFHVFLFIDWLETSNEKIAGILTKDSPFGFMDLDEDGTAEMIILYSWAYYVGDFASSPYYLRIFSLKDSTVRDVTGKFKDVITAAVEWEESSLQKSVSNPAKKRVALSKIVTILLLRLKGGLDEDAAWAAYERNCGHIFGDVESASHYFRAGIKEYMKRHDSRCKPRIE